MAFRYQELRVTEDILKLIDDIHIVVKTYPKEEMYGLSSQCQRAVTSVLLNIAEGSARNSKPEFARFSNIALGSLVEVHASLLIAIRRGYISKEQFDHLETTVQTVWRQLCALRDSQRP